MSVAEYQNFLKLTTKRKNLLWGLNAAILKIYELSKFLNFAYSSLSSYNKDRWYLCINTILFFLSEISQQRQ